MYFTNLRIERELKIYPVNLTHSISYVASGIESSGEFIQ